jgi:hypothetical protein
MCNPWKKTFMLVPLAPLIMISPDFHFYILIFFKNMKVLIVNF